MQPLSFLVLFAASSSATKLLLPLYQYPEGSTWDPVYNAIEANPNVGFQIIVNADSGPGGPSGPDSNFATGTAKLNSYPNVETLGYVHCLYGEASQEEITQNVTNWAVWNSNSGANTSIGGIFFDETPNTEGGSNDVSFMQGVMSAASSSFGSSQFTSMLNPGAAVMHDEFWDLASYIVIYEADASSYSESVLSTNIPSGKAAQSSILIYDFASVGSSSTADQWLQGMIAAGVGSAHILDAEYMSATVASGPATIASVAVVLAVSVDTGSTSGDTSSAGSVAPTTTVATQASSVASSATADTQAETTTYPTTTLLTSTKRPTSTSEVSAEATESYSPEPAETTDSDSPEPAETTALSSTSTKASGSSCARPTSTGRGYKHSHQRRAHAHAA